MIATNGGKQQLPLKPNLLKLMKNKESSDSCFKKQCKLPLIAANWDFSFEYIDGEQTGWGKYQA